MTEPRDDRLATIASAFADSGEPCWHIDRHVVEVDEARSADESARVHACAAAVALARAWRGEVTALRAEGMRFSMPYAVIDDEWLRGDEDAAPPHVYVCLAQDSASFHPVVYREAAFVATSGFPALDALLTGTERLRRLHGESPDAPGAWIITMHGLE